MKNPISQKENGEFEFKKLTDNSLVIKQIREVPDPMLAEAPAIALFDAPLQFKVFQCEVGSFFANHRLKAKLLFRTDKHDLITVELHAYSGDRIYASDVG